MPSDERTPLLQGHDSGNWWDFGNSYQDVDFHAQFCRLVGIPSSEESDHERHPIGPKTLYGRVLHQQKSQERTYAITAAISNTLLLAQVVIGAAVTALGASESSHILITLFGAANTIIAGIVAYLKSRGQPMRARMFRDDLERVVDEIENSEVMWLGITKGILGYRDIDLDSVTVRSEVARLTRLYERAVRSNTMNNPDMYLATGGDNSATTLRARPNQSLPAPPPAVTPGPSNSAAPAPSPAPPNDPDASPATAPPKAPKEETPKDERSKEETKKDEAPKEPLAESSETLKDGVETPTDDDSKGKAKEGDKPSPPPNAHDPDKSPATKS